MKKAVDNNKNTRPKRIFHVVTHLDVGGAERVAVNIAKSATPGTEYHVVEVIRSRTAFTRRLLDELQASGIRCHRAHIPDIRFHFVMERIAALLFPLWFLPLYLRLRPDVIHSHTEVPDMSVFAFFRLCPWVRKCRVVRTVHNTRLWTGQKRLGNIIEPFFARLRANVAISPSVRDSYLEAYGERLGIIYNGVEPVVQRTYPDLRKGRTNILFAGRLEQQKGVEHLLETLRRLDGDPRYFFHIMGDGSLRGAVEHAIRGMANARLTPPVFGLSSYLASFSCLFMPSEFEGLSILSIEASLASLPVVANDCPGLGDTLPPEWPLKVTGNDHDAYEHLFRDVIPRSDLTALGTAACRYANEHFGIRRMQEAYERMYFG